MSDVQERRKSILTEADMERIEASVERSFTRWAEAIGYDVTTPDSRLEIHKDHGFVRAARKAKNWVACAFLGGVGLSAWTWLSGGKG